MLLAAVTVAPAAGQTALNVDDAVKIAVQHNLSLQRSAWDLDAKKRQADNAWGVMIPSTSLTAGISRPNEATNLLGNSVTPSWEYSNSAGVSLSIAGSLLANLKLVAQNYRSGLLTYDVARRSLEKSVRQSYYNLLLEQENLKLEKSSIALKERSLADTQTKYKNGLSPELDVLSAQVALEQLKPQYDDLETTFLNDLGQFKVYLGVPLTTEIALTGSLNEAVEKALTLDKVPSLQGVDSPAVQEARMTVDSNRLSQESGDWGSWLPSLSLSYSTAPAWANTYGTGYAWADSGSLSLQLTYSLDSFFPWTASREKVVEAQETVRSSESQLEEARINSTLNRTNDVRKINQAVKSLSSLALNVLQAQKTYDLGLDAYNHGSKSLTDLLSSQNDLSTAQYNLLSERYTLLSTVLDLEYELDVPFGTLLGGKS
jgi:outer membrane protein TolC